MDFMESTDSSSLNRSMIILSVSSLFAAAPMFLIDARKKLFAASEMHYDLISSAFFFSTVLAIYGVSRLDSATELINATEREIKILSVIVGSIYTGFGSASALLILGETQTASDFLIVSLAGALSWAAISARSTGIDAPSIWKAEL